MAGRGTGLVVYLSRAGRQTVRGCIQERKGHAALWHDNKIDNRTESTTAVSFFIGP